MTWHKVLLRKLKQVIFSDDMVKAFLEYSYVTVVKINFEELDLNDHVIFVGKNQRKLMNIDLSFKGK